MRRILTTILLAAPVLIGTPATAGDQTPGQAVYLRYCGACHGPTGKGDGLAGSFMRPKPTDLTRLAKDNRGEFPTHRLIEVIDGRSTVRAHGEPDMPVWGEIFQDQAGWDLTRRAEVRGKILVIVDHLRSIQQK